MQLQTRPKLLPPLALMWQGPRPGPEDQVARRGSGSLSPLELRRIVADLIG